MSIKPPPAGRAKVWSPFWRRFSDQRATDRADTQDFHARVHSAWKASCWASPTALDAATDFLLNNLDSFRPIPDYMRDRIRGGIRHMLSLETHIFADAATDWSQHVSLKDQVELRRFLRAQQEFLNNDEPYLRLLSEITLSTFGTVIEALPKFPSGTTTTLSVSLLEALQVPPAVIIERITAILLSADLEESGLFQKLRETIYLNACRVSGIWPYEEPKKQMVRAGKSDLPSSDLFSAYLGDTPFSDLCDVQVPFQIPQKALSEHGFIIAKPGHGKTQLLGNFVAQFLQDPEQPGLFILDPAGDWFEVIRDRVPPERLVVLDPETNPPPLNFFDFRNTTQAHALQAFRYLMSTLTGGLSDRQNNIVPFVLNLLEKLEKPSLRVLRKIMDERPKKAQDSQYWHAIEQLEADHRDFFLHQFYNNDMNITKNSISVKIHGAMGMDAFKKMFTADYNSFDAGAAMAGRKVVLVRGSETTLGEYGLPIFMQYVVSQCFLAALARFRIPKEQRHQCYLICDEASHIFNHQTTRILTECRKLALSFIGATQLIEQIPKEVKAAIYGATSFKFAGEVGHSDATLMANEMRCKGEFIEGMTSNPPDYAEWAAYVSNVTKTAIKVTAPMMVLEQMPSVSRKPAPPPRHRPQVDLEEDPAVSPVEAAHSPNATTSTDDDPSRARRGKWKE